MVSVGTEIPTWSGIAEENTLLLKESPQDLTYMGPSAQDHPVLNLSNSLAHRPRLFLSWVIKFDCIVSLLGFVRVQGLGLGM